MEVAKHSGDEGAKLHEQLRRPRQRRGARKAHRSLFHNTRTDGSLEAVVSTMGRRANRAERRARAVGGGGSQEGHLRVEKHPWGLCCLQLQNASTGVHPGTGALTRG